MFSAETLLLGEGGRLGGVTATGSARITSYARPPFDFSWHLISVAVIQIQTSHTYCTHHNHATYTNKAGQSRINDKYRQVSCSLTLVSLITKADLPHETKME